jgi:hypothetical protein
VRHLAEASTLATKAGAADEAVLAAAARSLLPGGEPDAAARIYGSLSSRLRLPERMEAAYMLWKSTGDRTFLEEARRMAAEFRDHAPPHLREAQSREVPLLRLLAPDAPLPAPAEAGSRTRAGDGPPG